MPSDATGERGGEGRAGVLGLAGWALFDWANSPFTTLVITFVFPAYFASAVVGDEARGQILWGVAMATSGALIAILGPILGAIADATGRRKAWVAGCSLVCITGASMLWYVQPSPEWIAWGMVWVVVANVGFEAAGVFYNAMLPGIVGGERIGRLSGWGWGLGYAGGLAALVFALVAFVRAEQPLLGLDTRTAEHVRVIGPLVAVWLAVFALPLFAFTPEPGAHRRFSLAASRAALRRLVATAKELRRFGPVARFLLAHMFYADALVTIFAFGGVFAAGVFDMSIAEVITFGITLNVAAGIGAFAFGWIDDWLGSAQTVRLALVGLIVSGAAALMAPDAFWFWVFGALLGIFVGPAQAASRSLMARLAPSGRQAELFGLLALSGKATAFLGPALVALVTAATGSQRVGLAVVLLLFAAGLALLRGVSAGRG